MNKCNSGSIMMDLYIIIGFFILMIVFSLILWRSEKKRWNNGFCLDNGEPWVSFDMDSQGGRGYTAGDEILWVSWPYVDNERR